jgi:hypothetical protein
MALHNCAYRKPTESYHWAHDEHWNQHFNLMATSGTNWLNVQRLWIDPNGRRPADDIDPNHKDPNDTAKLSPPEQKSGNPYRIRSMDTKKYLGIDFDAAEREGLWMLVQFEIDPNYPPGVPSGKWLKGAFWFGDKYDWDGTWDLAQELNKPYWSGGDPNTMYRSEGRTALVANTARYDYWGNGMPSDIVWDDIEGRIGIWNGVARTITLNTIKPEYRETMTIDPIADPLFDPNDPNDPNNFNNVALRYTDGTSIVMSTAPISGKTFVGWTIWSDPNKYGDVNYAVMDANAVVYLTMDKDYMVDVEFKCGSGLPPFIAVALLALGVGLVIRRLW